MPKTHPQSYAYFMRKNLFDGLDIDPENTNIENGMAEDEAKECARYDALLEQLPRDIAAVGLGQQRAHRVQRAGHALRERHARCHACREHGEG